MNQAMRRRWTVLGLVILSMLGAATLASGAASSGNGLGITKVIPADGTTDVETGATILVAFDRPVVPLIGVSDPAAANLPDPLHLSPSVAGEGEWLNTSTYTFTPSEPLAGGTTYTATVPAGLTDVAGDALADAFVWTFTTVRPRVVRVDPSRDAELVPVDASIRIQFNMPIAAASVADRLTVRAAGLLGELFAQTLPGAIAVDGETMTFEPYEPLAFDRRYVVTLEPGVTGPAGGLGTSERTSWRFTTVPLPRIVATDPADGEDDAYPYTSFAIRFNTPIDPETVMAHVSIDPEPNPDVLDTWYRTWDSTFVIRFGAEPSREYAVRIEAGIADVYGNETTEAMTVRFRTAPLSPVAWLHVPGRTSTLDAGEPARLVVGHRNTDRLRLRLWRIDLVDYFEAVDDWYDFEPAGRPTRAWSVPVAAPLNEAAYAPVDLVDGGGPLEPGLYVVDLRADDVDWDRWHHRHLLVSSPVNLTLKTTADETLAWATDLGTGRPVPGLVLWAYDGDGEQVDASVTDSDGLASFSGSETDWRGLTIVGRDPFVLADDDWNDGISVWDLGLHSETPPDRRAYLDTDRPIYRPGQTVFFRGLVRDEDDVAYALPNLSSITVTVRDPEWEIVYEETLSVDDLGSFDGAIELPDDAALGDYALRAETDERTFYHAFQVAAYRPPEFEMTVVADRDEVGRDEAIRAIVHAEYFFGAPVADVAVDWHVLSDAYRFAPDAFGRYSFDDVDDPWICWSCWWIPPAPPTSVLDGSGSTDADGDLLVDLPADVAGLSSDPDADPVAGSRLLTIEATSTGPSGETISGRTRVVVHAASFYVGLAASRSIGRAGEEANVDVVTVDWSGNRLAAIPLRYTVFRREWENVFEEDETGGGRWTWTKTDTEVAAGALATDGSGDGRFAFVPPEGGTYKVVVEGDDDAGRTARASIFLWVTSPESVSWRRTNDDVIALVSDRTSYAVGETAEILVPSPYPGEQWALLTVERGGILSREVVHLPSNSSLIRVPITEDHVPNVYVSVVLVQGRDAALEGAGGPATAGIKVGSLALSVDPGPKTLRIDLAPAAERLEPGEAVAIDLHVTDAGGDPVRAALSLDLVDKAILSLKPRTAGAILSEFYARRGLGVRTSSGLTISLSRLVLEKLDDLDLVEADDRAFEGEDAVGEEALMMAPEAAPAGAGRAAPQAAEKLPEGIALREEFLDTAYWNANVVTDENGFARVELELPDNLTTWVVRAVGATAQTLVGEATTEILVTKPLLVRPAVPRFFVVGDRVRLAASVSNQTEIDRTVEVTLGAVGVELADPATQSVTIPAESEATISWWATVLDVDAADLAFAAVSGELADAARPRLTLGPDGTVPVFRYTARETVGTSGELTGEGSRVEAIALPPNVDLAASELAVRLDPSLAAAMVEALTYLEHFEYECTEQLVSRFLPNALSYRALVLLGIDDPELRANLDRLVSEGLAELVDRQNPDGGWGWWDGERSSAYLTAYATFALVRVAELDVAVDADVLDRALDYLERALDSPREIESTWDANRNAWIVYVLSLARPSVASEVVGGLFDKRDLLSHYARAYLALAFAETGDPRGRIDALVADLVGDAILSATGAHWEEEAVDWWAMNTDTRSTAIILDALVRIDPGNALLPNAVRWLMVAREAGIWETTQENAWALIALVDWMVATGELDGDYELRVGLDEAPLLADRVSAETIRIPREITVPGTDLAGEATHTLTVTRGLGPGILYYTAHLTVGLPVGEVGALDRGIGVERTYGSIEETGEERTAIEVGETVEVRLTIVAPNDLYYVVVEDPIPAGCEAVDPSLATTSLLAPGPDLTRDDEDRPWWGGWWRWYSRSEFRDDKVVLFVDSLPAGTYTFSYVLRGVTPGTYGVLPTQASEFYFPEVFGRSDGRVFRVVE